MERRGAKLISMEEQLTMGLSGVSRQQSQPCKYKQGRPGVSATITDLQRDRVRVPEFAPAALQAGPCDSGWRRTWQDDGE